MRVDDLMKGGSLSPNSPKIRMSLTKRNLSFQNFKIFHDSSFQIVLAGHYSLYGTSSGVVQL